MRCFSLLLIITFLSTQSFSQKQLTINEAEQLLQKNNLLLLAEQYNITAAQAATIQAKIWEQPYLSGEVNAINPQNNKVFDIGASGQKAVAIQQLIYLGGKKKNEVAYAKGNAALAELEFEQLLRNLKFQLAQSYYSLYFDKQKLNSIDTQIIILDNLLVNYKTQANKGNIPLSEVVRLQSLVLNLKNDKTSLFASYTETQQNLALLIGTAESVEPVINEPELLSKFQNKSISKENILTLALENNIEYLRSIKESENQSTYLKWQKSLSVPDINTGLSYDQRGGAFSNQVNLTLGIPLPLWNKNKGNIKAAKAQLDQSNLIKDYKKTELETTVEKLWQQWQQQVYQYGSIDKSTTQNLQQVYSGTLNNFQKRNITMLEFTDFMESYKLSTIQLNELKKSLVLSGVSINFITNKEIF
jgi:cobalt-zinc-cadmium efflux system outer membrane protein